MDDFLMPYEVQLEHDAATSSSLMTILSAQRSPGQPATRHLLPPGVYMVYLAYNGAAEATLQHVGGGTTNTSSVAKGTAGKPRTSSPIKISVQGTTEYLQVVAPADTGESARATISVLPATTFDEVTESGQGGPTYSLSSAITPQDFGAKADGVTDDTQAIQAALDSVPVSGGIVLFPAGVYLVSGQRLRHGSEDTQAAIFPNPNTTLRGEGLGSIIRLNDGTNKVDMVYAFETPGLRFENITIDAGPRLLPYWTTCIQLNTCDDLVMRNVTIVNGNIEGVYVFNSTRFDINGVHAHHNGAFREDASGLHMDSCYGGNIDNINAHNNGFHGVIISSSWEINLSNIQARHNGWQGLHIQTGSNKLNVSNAVLTNNARGLYIRDWGTDNNVFNNLVVAHNSFNGVMTYVTYGNVINGLQAIGNGEYGVQTGVNEDELFVWAGHFQDNGWGDYDSVDDSKLYINGTLV